MPQTPPRFHLIQIRLGRDLAQYVQERRASGDPWRRISQDLTAVTGVPVSYETLRTWFMATPERAA